MDPVLDAATTEAYARAGLANIRREYPNHPGHLLTGEEDLRAPSQLHPIFYGCFDWHSSVHQHWMLVRLLRRSPRLGMADAVRNTLDRQFDVGAARIEAAYFQHPQRRSFERPYGWAWLLTLAAELEAWGEAAPRRWAAALQPLTDTVRGRCLDWLAGTRYPQRAGTHGNSAFACALLLDAANVSGDVDLAEAAVAAAWRWYAADAGYPAWIEPSATDFLSPALVEADLMARIVPGDGFPEWLEGFLPVPDPLEEPVVVTERGDPQGVHLDGLNLSRAWCWRRIGATLPADHPWRPAAHRAAARHAVASLPAVLSGDYVAEHWLPSFAVYLFEGALVPPGT
ncbi:hypothetical protein TVNIR_0578 [Thioalkalivibrio nitratireducens DSM 14787]|uniref:DUF2891 domain-containing protein n=1 Tax=Thioalkalivibrio nitratireducens (strain DSM 14787 / UNIQEM 213 / ALEN2) TaxID=1255043 RepID=L0DRR1_THIND|nr:DUF2891 domain-containing protein [Thioalkalivibrio nitratireducens]AGA32279.1 hypothetical protein TVNIR_0578 [Thioalkalivibrio nitratireducens DSM 14787]